MFKFTDSEHGCPKQIDAGLAVSNVCYELGNLPEDYDHKYKYSHLAHNLKIADMQAACALVQLENAPEFIG